MTPTPDPASLRAFARAHRVTAELSPHYEMNDQLRTQTGFDLALLALPLPRYAGDPGSEECERVHALLRELALAVVPDAWHHAETPFEAAFRYRAQTRWCPEIELVVEITPPTRGVVDDAARREITGIRKRLHHMGVSAEPRTAGSSRAV
jgi:hypothetical protein